MTLCVHGWINFVEIEEGKGVSFLWELGKWNKQENGKMCQKHPKEEQKYKSDFESGDQFKKITRTRLKIKIKIKIK